MPQTVSDPASAASSPQSRRSSVDLPEPVCPTMAVVARTGTSRLTPSSAWAPGPYEKPKSRARIASGLAAGAQAAGAAGFSPDGAATAVTFPSAASARSAAARRASKGISSPSASMTCAFLVAKTSSGVPSSAA